MKEPRLLYVVMTNTDLTEGRGRQYPIAYSFNDFTARRLASKKGVMGSDANIDAVMTSIIDDVEMIPISMINIERPTDKDISDAVKRDEKATLIEKAKQLGLSEDEIKKLTSM